MYQRYADPCFGILVALADMKRPSNTAKHNTPIRM